TCALPIFKEVQLLPGREFPMDESARNQFRARFREIFEGDPSRALPYKDIGNGIAFAGVEYYLPLFFEGTATLFDYLPEQAVTVTLGDINQAIQRFAADTHSRYQFFKSDRERPVLPPGQLFLDEEDLFTRLKSFPRLALVAGEPHPDFFQAPDVAVARRADDPLANLRMLLGQGRSKVVLCADSPGRRETLMKMRAEFGIRPDSPSESLQEALESATRFALVTAPLTNGFGLAEQGLTLLTENNLYPTQARTLRRGKRAQQA